MARRCGTKNSKSTCRKPRANWWRASMGVDWYGSSGGGAVEQEEATAFFARLLALGTPVPEDEKPYHNDVVYWLKNTMGIDGVTSYWNSLDVLNIQGVHSETASLHNLISDAHHATIVSGHASDFTAYEGAKGNGSSYRRSTGFNPGDGGTYKFAANSGSMGFCSLTDQSGTVQDLSALGAGGTSGSFIRARRAVGQDYDFDGAINITGTIGATIAKTAPLSIGVFEIRKTAAGVVSAYMNGVRQWALTGATDGVQNIEFSEFSSNANGSFAQWSNKAHSYRWFGSGNIDSNVLMGIMYKYWFKPINNANSALGKRLFFVGDSQTGNAAGTTASVASQMARKTLETVGPGWVGVQIGVASRQLEGTEFGVTPDINSQISVEITPFRNTYFDKDIVVIWAGTNDLASISTITGQAVYDRLNTFRTAVKAAGFKVIVVGVPDRDASFLNGQTQGGFDTDRDAMRTLLLAEFNIATATSNVWMNAAGEVYCDLYGDARFQNAADATYFHADTIHLNTTGHDLVGTAFVAPAALML